MLWEVQGSGELENNFVTFEDGAKYSKPNSLLAKHFKYKLF